MNARFVAHIERPDGRVHHIDCDAAHENDSGRLSLTVNTYVGAIACYAPGAWTSYHLEPAPAGAELRTPMFGDRVHVWVPDLGCCPGTVDSLISDSPSAGNLVALQIKTDEPIKDCPLRVSSTFDPGMQTPGSWHWPHDDEQAAAALPNAPAPVTVTINVADSVLAERDLEHRIASQLSRIAAQRGIRY